MSHPPAKQGEAGPRPPREEFLVFGSPLIGEEEIDEVVAVMRSGWLGTGPRAAEFEDRFRAYTGAAHSLALNSCTAALHLSMLAAGLGPGRRGDHDRAHLLRNGQLDHPRRGHDRCSSTATR